MTATEGKTYFRPSNAETGEPLLLTHFTAPLCTLGDAAQHDLKERTDELAADVRDHLDSLSIPIRPTILHGRIQVLQETEPDENGFNRAPEVFSTVLVFLTDAEPGDPRLERLADGFHAPRINAQVEFSIPTEESVAAAMAAREADARRGREYVAKATEERAAAVREAADPFGGDMENLFD